MIATFDARHATALAAIEFFQVRLPHFRHKSIQHRIHTRQIRTLVVRASLNKAIIFFKFSFLSATPTKKMLYMSPRSICISTFDVNVV